MRELNDALKRAKAKSHAFENMTDELHRIEDKYRTAATHTVEQDIEVTTTTGMNNVRITVHFYSEELHSKLVEIFDSDVWHGSTIYQNGGHAKSKSEYRYHIVCKRELRLADFRE